MQTLSFLQCAHEVPRIQQAGVGSGIAIGVLETRVAVLGLALFPLVLLGNWLGSLAFGKVSDRAWRIAVGVVLAGAAAAALARLL